MWHIGATTLADEVCRDRLAIDLKLAGALNRVR